MGGTAFNLALLTVLSNPLLYLCLFLNLYRLYKRGFVLFGRQIGGDEDEEVRSTLHSLSLQVFTDHQKAVIAGLYWSLFLANAAGLAIVAKSLRTPRELRVQQQAEERQRREE